MKIEYFKKAKVAHPKLSAAFEEIRQLIFPSPSASMILLVGPPGVGKSLLLELLFEFIMNLFRTEMLLDPGLIPILVTMAASPEDRSFSWKNFYSGLIRKLGGQLHTSVAGLRDGVERTLHGRGTRVLAIDEAVHLLRGNSDRFITAHVDSLKSLASISGVTILLSGSYDLLSVPSLSGQIARRVSIVHFPRYYQGYESEETAFKMALEKLTVSMPIDGPIELNDIHQELHACMNGCIGVLKDTLMNALKRSLNSASGKWNKTHFRKALPTPSQLDAMIRETEEGEKLLSKNDYKTGSNLIIQNCQNALREKKQ